MATETTKIPFVEGSAPATPAANRSVIYVKTDGLFYSKDDAGVETLMSGGGGANPQFTTIELGHASDTTIARASAGNLTVEGNALYRAGGTDVALADGGTGASLTDPNADRIMFWDDSAGAVTWLTPGTNLTITTTTIDAAGGSTPSGTLVEVDYVEFTSGVTITATTEATANTVVTANALSADGSTKYAIEFYAEYVLAPSSVSIFLCLYDGSSSIGIVGQIGNGVLVIGPMMFVRRLTPSNASHTYSVRAYVGSGSGTVNGGAGGSGNPIPGYIRIVKITS